MAELSEGLRAGLLEAADVEQAYKLAQGVAESVNYSFNTLTDREELTSATSLLARALAARALLLVAGDWWVDLSSGARPPEAYRQAIRSFIDRAPPGYVDRSEIGGPDT